MAYVEAAVRQFKGLRFDVNPLELGLNGALAAHDVSIDPDGRLRPRPGYTNYADAGTDVDGYLWWCKFIERNHDNPTLLVAQTKPSNLNDQLKPVGLIGSFTSGGQVSPEFSGNVSGAVAYSDPTASVIYALVGGVAPALLKYDGAAWTSTTLSNLNTPQGLAVTPWDNRLVAIDQANKVWFSGAGAPTTWGATDFVGLYDQDAGLLTAVCTWRDQVFVFGTDRFWVFYGVSTDSTGGAVFNYRSVDGGQAGAQSLGELGSPVAATPLGVFMANRAGVWVTTGGAAQRVSGPVQPLFEGRGVGDLEAGEPVGCYWDGVRLYVPMSAADGPNYTLVYRPDIAAWTSDSRDTRSLSHHDRGNPGLGPATVWIDGFTDRYLRRSLGTELDDAGTAIAWEWRSGDVPPPDKTNGVVRELLLDGAGTITARVISDGNDDQSPESVQLDATDPRARQAARGRKRVAVALAAPTDSTPSEAARVDSLAVRWRPGRPPR